MVGSEALDCSPVLVPEEVEAPAEVAVVAVVVVAVAVVAVEVLEASVTELVSSGRSLHATPSALISREASRGSATAVRSASPQKRQAASEGRTWRWEAVQSSGAEDLGAGGKRRHGSSSR